MSLNSSSPLFEHIFKICILDSTGNPFGYYIFLGESSYGYPQEFFSNVEWSYIQEQQLQKHILFSDIMIHRDDSIETIKKKILYTSQKYDNIVPFDYEDIYLWAITHRRMSLLNIYKRLTQHDTKPLKKEMLVQFLMNFIDDNDDDDMNLLQEIYSNPVFEKQEIFSYEHLQEIDWFSLPSNKLCCIPLGMRFIETPHDDNDDKIILNSELFLCNPFLHRNSKIYVPSAHVSLQLFEHDFMFHYGSHLQENTIYMALSRDTLEYAKLHKIDSEYILSLYYPRLFSKSDYSKQNSKAKNADVFLEEQPLVDLFYKIYAKEKMEISSSLSNIEFKQEGIQSFFLILHPDHKNELPLETVFKNMHANSLIPLIQYNPGKKRDIMYRVYYEEVSQNGNNIPFLSRDVLSKFIENPGKTQNITMFLQIPGNYRGEMKFIHISFEQNGNIVIRGKLEKALMPERFNVWLQEIIRPAIQQMNDYLQQSGYEIRSFQNIRDDFVEVVYLTYKCEVTLPKTFEFEAFSGFLSPFFYNELSSSENPKNNTKMISKRYKRIEYFKQMDPVEAYISELLRFTQDTKIIRTELKKEFSSFSDTKIQEVMKNYQDKHRSVMVPGRFTNKKIELLEHTGFRTIFHKNELDNHQWTVEIQDIVLSEYIDVLHIYIHAFFEITQIPDIVPKEISKQFKNKKIATPRSSPIVSPTLNMIPLIIPIFEEGEGEGEGEDEIVETNIPKEEEEEEEFKLEDEYETEEEDDNSSNKKSKESYEDVTHGGSEKKKSKKSRETKIGGETTMSTLANYFTNRITDRDELLSNSGYARVCQASKQPIILTEKEKQKIDKQYKKNNLPYQNVLKYGKDKENNQLYYICPKYWCIKSGEEGPLTEEEVNQKKCGEIIQDNDHIQEGEYTYMSREGLDAPGFVNRKAKSDKVHIDPQTGMEICYPCCFKNWSGEAQKKMRNQCNPEEYSLTENKKKKLQEKQDNLNAASNTRYIYEMNRVPLLFKRMGDLPFAVQMFLNVSSSNICIDSFNMPKLNCPFFIRYGVIQPNSNQYFLSCLADIYSYQRNKPVPISIQEMRNSLCEAITIDIFVQLHNASLVALFQNQYIENIENISLDSYKKSQLYQNINIDDETQLSFLESTIISYENFLSYLRDENAIIDHTYLWEAICQENPLLFPRGMNLAIMEILHQDSTNNIELLCPTSAYKTPLYDPNKETLLLVKQNEVYEPIYLYEIKSFNPEISSYKKTFKPTSSGIGYLSVVLNMMYSISMSKCAPIQSKSFMFQRNHSAKEIQKYLKEIPECTIQSQVVNYQNKCIGFLVKSKNQNEKRKEDFVSIYVPTFPSSLFDSIDRKWMDDPTIYEDYETTVDMLKHIYYKSNKKIVCMPIYRVVDDEKVIGILTMTNQFIQIMPFIDNIGFQDELKTWYSSNYIVADKQLQIKEIRKSSLIPSDQMNDREKMVRNIRLENQFYSSFRSTVRIVLNLYISRKVKKYIQGIFYSTSYTYLVKIKKIEKELKRMMEGLITFQYYDENVLDSLTSIYTCQSDCSNKTYCLVQDSITNSHIPCKLILPYLNLVNGEPNEKIYYDRLSDELLRYRRIQMFMLQPDDYMNFSGNGASDMEYKIYPNEFVIPRMLLLDDHYFSDLKPYPLKKYARTTAFETTNPIGKPKANPVIDWKEEYTKTKTEMKTVSSSKKTI